MGKYIGKFEKKKKKNKKKVGLIVLLIILSLLLVVLLGGVIYYNSVLNQINRFEDNTETLPSEVLESIVQDEGSDMEVGENIGTVPSELDVMTDEEEVIGGKIINVLLIGQDTRDAKQRGLSDSMILISVNTETKKLVMTSFLRDLYIDIPGDRGGYYRQRINTAYAVGGMEKLNATIAHNFGVEVDNNVEVDFSGFQTIVDAMGGLDIELSKAEAHHLNSQYANLGWKLTEGMNHLTGEQALGYARIRKIDSDFYRTERQRIVLNKLFEKVKGMGVTELLSLAKEFIPLITTDMTNSEITGYIMELAPILPELEVITQRIPVDGGYRDVWVGNMLVLMPDLETNRKALSEILTDEKLP